MDAQAANAAAALILGEHSAGAPGDAPESAPVGVLEGRKRGADPGEKPRSAMVAGAVCWFRTSAWGVSRHRHSVADN
jgi:hypothetical protein